MINISKYTSEDNTPRLAAPPLRTAAATGAPARTMAGGLFREGRDRRNGHRERAPASRIPFAAAHILATTGRVLLSWLAAIPRRLGDRLFVMNDTEAYWRSWQITRIHGGLGRRYRDPRFAALAECPRCRGTGRAQGGAGSRAQGGAGSRTQGGAGSRTQGGAGSRARGGAQIRVQIRVADLPCAPCLGTGRVTLGEVS